MGQNGNKVAEVARGARCGGPAIPIPGVIHPAFWGLSSNNSSKYWLDRLEADGRIRRARRQAHSRIAYLAGVLTHFAHFGKDLRCLAPTGIVLTGIRGYAEP